VVRWAFSALLWLVWAGLFGGPASASPANEVFASVFGRPGVDLTMKSGYTGSLNSAGLFASGPKFRAAWDSGTWWDPRVNPRIYQVRSEAIETSVGWRHAVDGFAVQVMAGVTTRFETPLRNPPRLGALVEVDLLWWRQNNAYIALHMRGAELGTVASLSLSSGWPVLEGLKLGPQGGVGLGRDGRVDVRAGGVATLVNFFGVELSLSAGWSRSSFGRSGYYLASYAVRRF
jgi:hypothetical protein